MTYYAGETITDSVVAIFGDTPVTGSPTTVFVDAKAYRPDNTWVSPTIVEVGNGHYDVTFTTLLSLPGEYAVDLLDKNGVRYLATYNVEPAFAASLGNRGIARSELRVMIGDLLRDHLRLTAAGGSETTLTDPVNLLDSEDAFRSCEGIVVAGHTQNVGRRFRVESSSEDGYTITFAPALPQPLQPGDVVDLFNMGGYGFRVQYYDSDINAAIRMAHPEYLVDQVWDVASAAPPIDLADTVQAVYRVEYQDTDGLWGEVPRARRAGRYGQGWSIDKGNRRLRIDGDWGFEASGRALRIHGYVRHPETTVDTDRVAIDSTWMTYMVASLLAARRNSDQQWNNWAVEWGRNAAEYRLRMQTNRSPNAVWV